MTRYTPDGKRIVNRPQRYEVPGELCADIDAGAARVKRLQADRDAMQDQARRLEHQAFKAGQAADLASHPGLRKMLHDQAVQLQQEAGHARVRLGRAERDLAENMSALGGLHREARAWQRGEYEED